MRVAVWVVALAVLMGAQSELTEAAAPNALARMVGSVLPSLSPTAITASLRAVWPAATPVSPCALDVLRDVLCGEGCALSQWQAQPSTATTTFLLELRAPQRVLSVVGAGVSLPETASTFHSAHALRCGNDSLSYVPWPQLTLDISPPASPAPGGEGATGLLSTVASLTDHRTVAGPVGGAVFLVLLALQRFFVDNTVVQLYSRPFYLLGMVLLLSGAMFTLGSIVDQHPGKTSDSAVDHRDAAIELGYFSGTLGLMFLTIATYLAYTVKEGLERGMGIESAAADADDSVAPEDMAVWAAANCNTLASCVACVSLGCAFDGTECMAVNNDLVIRSYSSWSLDPVTCHEAVLPKEEESQPCQSVGLSATGTEVSLTIKHAHVGDYMASPIRTLAEALPLPPDCAGALRDFEKKGIADSGYPLGRDADFFSGYSEADWPAAFLPVSDTRLEGERDAERPLTGAFVDGAVGFVLNSPKCALDDTNTIAVVTVKSMDTLLNLPSVHDDFAFLFLSDSLEHLRRLLRASTVLFPIRDVSALITGKHPFSGHVMWLSASNTMADGKYVLLDDHCNHHHAEAAAQAAKFLSRTFPLDNKADMAAKRRFLDAVHDSLIEPFASRAINKRPLAVDLKVARRYHQFAFRTKGSSGAMAYAFEMLCMLQAAAASPGERCATNLEGEVDDTTIQRDHMRGFDSEHHTTRAPEMLKPDIVHAVLERKHELLRSGLNLAMANEISIDGLREKLDAVQEMLEDQMVEALETYVQQQPDGVMPLAALGDLETRLDVLQGYAAPKKNTIDFLGEVLARANARDRGYLRIEGDNLVLEFKDRGG